ncbi:MAG: acetylornithine deacetylase [Rhodospirillaceae bacterium]|jgi:acetylornithine deacetylase|uniref:acetylornithine deacetylase n=1 Tax=unclassified Hwanghaeella TaxID=2605944 RepID=UPI000C537E14|nr:acetylornithine deacetylase [Rhodospirillales bacterium]MAX46699.1 acetylornithine deacetylase [Rhodospirillaceae bacterium]|tara:strand:+ start:82241 stop:83398 length:1158 start_codon:yes stop_codon:yes gene_type:complete
MKTLDILDRLLAFPTVSLEPNLDLILFVEDVLRQAGATVQVLRDESGTKANLYATIGQVDQAGGVLLSGHTDVVPVKGQAWTKPPFQMTQEDGKVYGRGTADMKGFVACAIAAMVRASQYDLKTPLHMALSYDEEIGCIGVRSLLDVLADAPFKPGFCIVGEPTSLAVATGHKGKTVIRATCTGREGHSALAPQALNAIHLATDLIAVLRQEQAALAASDAQDADYDVPYSTVHVGLIQGGVALNIVPNHCQLDFEIRNIAQDDPAEILNRIRAAADNIVARHSDDYPEVSINFEITNSYPGLLTPESSDVVAFVKSLTGANATMKVAFGTEAGLFTQRLSLPTVVCGPGSMAQGHKPDEFVTLVQLQQCDQMLDALIARLRDGL